MSQFDPTAPVPQTKRPYVFKGERKRRSRHQLLMAAGPTHLSLLVIDGRKGLNLSQHELAVAADRTQPWISGIESGSIWNITFLDIRALADGLSMAPMHIWNALQKTYTDLSPAAGIPTQESGQHMRVGKGEVIIESHVTKKHDGSPKLTTVEESMLRTGDFSKAKEGEGDFGWAGVGSIQLDVDSLPVAEDAPLDLALVSPDKPGGV